MSGTKAGRRWGVAVAAIAAVLAGCDGGVGSDATDESRPWATMSSETGHPCGSDANSGRAAIERYVSAWNEGDADALAAMITGTYEGNMRCKFAAALATQVTLSADFHRCVLSAEGDRDDLPTWSMDVWLFDLSTSYSGDGILSASEIPRDVVAAYGGDDAAVLAYWDCDGCGGRAALYTAEQEQVIENYVDAFNTQDLDAMMSLFAEDPSGGPTSDQTRAQHEALFRTGLTLRVDLEQGTFTLSDEDGNHLNPSRNGPCLAGWVPVFGFDDDGRANALAYTSLAAEVVSIDDARHLLEDDARRALDEAVAAP